MVLASQYEQMKAFTSINNQYIYKEGTGVPKSFSYGGLNATLSTYVNP
jgi:hypothetical protein